MSHVLDDIIAELEKGHPPRWWLRRALVYAVLGPVQRAGYDGGIDVMTAEWDNLLLLDACRSDLFEETADLGVFDEYRVVRSPASATKEWVETVFAGREFGDTVYVTANPYVSKLASGAFHDVKHVWRTHYDTEHGTVLPDSVNAVATAAHDEHPNKRLVVHYMQPHHPFLGDDWGTESFHNPHQREPFELLEEGGLDAETVWNGYRENLERVLRPAIALADALDGRTVVTSDHGNMLGERLSPIPIRGYGHSVGLRAPELVNVPWAVIDGDGRSVRTGSTTSSPVDPDSVDERLRHLGYRH